MDEDADREPEPPARIKERRKRLAELERQFQERRQELEEKAAGDLWEFWPETHDDPYDLNLPDEPSESRDVFDGLFL